MKTSLGMFTLLVALAAHASAQESAEMVQTTGTGALMRASEQMIDPARGSISIRLPATVRKGEVIAIQYDLSGSSVADSFMVTGITVQGGGCAIESRRYAANGSTLSDMIHARPCEKLE
jgi:hypothetical protein